VARRCHKSADISVWSHAPRKGKGEKKKRRGREKRVVRNQRCRVRAHFVSAREKKEKGGKKRKGEKTVGHLARSFVWTEWPEVQQKKREGGRRGEKDRERRKRGNSGCPVGKATLPGFAELRVPQQQGDRGREGGEKKGKRE